VHLYDIYIYRYVLYVSVGENAPQTETFRERPTRIHEYLCIYICVYVYIYIYICICIYICIYIHVCVYVYIYIYIYMCINIFICAFVRICTYIYNIYLDINMYIFMHPSEKIHVK